MTALDLDLQQKSIEKKVSRKTKKIDKKLDVLRDAIAQLAEIRNSESQTIIVPLTDYKESLRKA